MACPLLYWSREASGRKLLSWSWAEGGGRLSNEVRFVVHSMLLLAYHKVDVRPRQGERSHAYCFFAFNIRKG